MLEDERPRLWTKRMPLGLGAFKSHLEAMSAPAEDPNDMKMPPATAPYVHIHRPKERPAEATRVNPPQHQTVTRVHAFDFEIELKRPPRPFAVDIEDYLQGADEERTMQVDRCKEIFRKAGVPARHLQFLTDPMTSERLPWERTKRGFYGAVSNQLYESLVAERSFDEFGEHFAVPADAVSPGTTTSSSVGADNRSTPNLPLPPPQPPPSHAHNAHTRTFPPEAHAVGIRDRAGYETGRRQWRRRG